MTKEEKNCLLLLVLASSCLYLRTVGFSFIELDDPKHIYENELIRHLSVSNLIEIWSQPYFSLYIPVVYTAWSFIAQLSQTIGDQIHPAYFHGANFLFHTLNSLLVFQLLLIFSNKKTWPAFLGALLFCCHPLQVEAIAWVSGLKDILSSFFALSALWMCLRGKNTFATCLYALGLLSKPTLVVLPAVLWILSKNLKVSLVWAALALPIVFLTQQIQPASELVVPIANRLWIAMDSFGFYVMKVFLPFDLLIDYGRTPTSVLQNFFLPTLILALLLIVFIFRKTLRPGTLIAILFLLPVSGIMPFLFQKFSTVADRYAYLALFGVSLCLVAIAKSTIVFRVSLAFVLIVSVMTLKQVGYWKDSVSVFSHTVRHNPKSFLAHNNLGVAYFFRNEPLNAAEHFSRVAELRPEEAEAYVNWGAALMAGGRHVAGLVILNKALTLAPDSELAEYNLAKAYLQARHYSKALKHSQRILSRNPDNVRAKEVLLRAKARFQGAESGAKDRKG